MDPRVCVPRNVGTWDRAARVLAAAVLAVGALAWTRQPLLLLAAGLAAGALADTAAGGH